MEQIKFADLAWGIVGNIVASLFVAIANILFGHFFSNFSREILDFISLSFPLAIILIFLYRKKIKHVRIKPSITIVILITTFVIVSAGVSVRWYYEQRIERTILPVYSSYQQIYDFLAPQNDTP